MEAAGIEPASCDPLATASTCVFRRLSLAGARLGEQCPAQASHDESRVGRSGLSRRQPEFGDPAFGLLRQGFRSQSYLGLLRQRELPAFRQILFDQLFTWPTDQPRHATGTYGDPVESNRPPI